MNLIYIHSDFSARLGKKHALCSRVRNGFSRSFKVAVSSTDHSAYAYSYFVIDSNLVHNVTGVQLN